MTPSQCSSRALLLHWARTVCGDDEGEKDLHELLPQLQQLPRDVLTALGPGMKPYMVHALISREEETALGLIAVWPLSDYKKYQNDVITRTAATYGPVCCLELIIDRLEKNIAFSALLQMCASNRAVPKETIEKILLKMEASDAEPPARWFWQTIIPAAEYDRADVVEALLACSLDRGDSSSTGFPVATAASNNSMRVLRLLTDELSEVVMKEEEATAALTAATFRGKAEALTFLLDIYPAPYIAAKPLAHAAVQCIQTLEAWAPLQTLVERLPLDVLIREARPRFRGSYLHAAVRTLSDAKAARVVELSPGEVVANARDEDKTVLMVAASSNMRATTAAALQKVDRAHASEVDKEGRCAADLTTDATIRSMLQPCVKSAAGCA